jgi:hypothetical protein
MCLKVPFNGLEDNNYNVLKPQILDLVVLTLVWFYRIVMGKLEDGRVRSRWMCWLTFFVEVSCPK